MTKPRDWFERKIGELRALLGRMSEDRQRAFRDDVLEASSASQGDDRAPAEGEPAPDNDRAPEHQPRPKGGPPGRS